MIRESAGETDLPAIALTDLSHCEMQQILQAGFQACFQKRAEPEEVAAKVAHLTGRSWNPGASAALQT
jgi:hypothetical protein